MKIVDFFWMDEKTCIYTVDVTDLLNSAEELFVDVKRYLNVYEIWSSYVMENEDETQIYSNNGSTYDMSKANQERVLEFVVKEIWAHVEDLEEEQWHAWTFGLMD